VIGCGRIGAAFASTDGAVLTHAAAYAASPLTELVGVCDTNPDAATEAARRWGVAECYTDVRDLLASAQPALVSICTPDPTHSEIGEQVVAFPSVRGVLMEKPLAMTVAEAERLVARARDGAISLAVNYSRRWADGIRQAGGVIRQGRLGTVQSVTGYYANGWLHNGTHWIDLARMLVGEVVSARALRSPTRESQADCPLDTELEFLDGARGIVMGQAGQGLSFFEMDIVCGMGRVRLSEGAETIDIYELRASRTYPGFSQYAPLSAIRGGLDRALVNAVEDLARCVCDGGSPACSGDDGVAALRVAESVRAAGGAWTHWAAGGV
jgi:predicted dehydrogenase